MVRWKDKIIKILGGYTEPLMSEPVPYIVHEKRNTIKLRSEVQTYCGEMMPEKYLKKLLAKGLIDEVEKYMHVEFERESSGSTFRATIEIVVGEGGGTDD